MCIWWNYLFLGRCLVSFLFLKWATVFWMKAFYFPSLNVSNDNYVLLYMLLLHHHGRCLFIVFCLSLQTCLICSTLFLHSILFSNWYLWWICVTLSSACVILKASLHCSYPCGSDYLSFDSIEVNDNTVGEYVYLSAFCVLDHDNSHHNFVQNILLCIQGLPVKFVVFL